ncbi:MAG: GNAT family N-acetyltransferase [Oscillospiraceae bacterium]|nr:GNAT family N-acetyltransferase [Oscillospiraceae bacterium]
MLEITTRRLRLAPFTPEQMKRAVTDPSGAAAEIGAKFTEYDKGGADMRLIYERRLELILKRPEQWLFSTMWQIVLLSTGELAGELGFKGILPGAETEVGYSVRNAFSGRGLMTEALGGLLEFAGTRQYAYIDRVSALTQPYNKASMRVLEKNGFVNEGRRFALLYWVRKI